MADSRIEPASIEPFGDAAILVTFGARVDPELAARARAAATTIDGLRERRPGFGRPVPAHATVLVPIDPLNVDMDRALGLVAEQLAGAELAVVRAEPAGMTVQIPVRYGGADGPDLEVVADLHGLRPADVVELHASVTYPVLFLGFAPGFAYLGGLPAALVTPRRASPRERVPAGSVGIAGEQTGIYPMSMPGGWQLIGRTEVVLFDPAEDPPALLRPGRSVRFVPAR